MHKIDKNSCHTLLDRLMSSAQRMPSVGNTINHLFICRIDKTGLRSGTLSKTPFLMKWSTY